MSVVLNLLDKPFPPDIRLERHARTLLRAGFEVHVLARDENSGPRGVVPDFTRGLRREPAPTVPLRPGESWRLASGEVPVGAGCRVRVHTLTRRRVPFLGGRDLRFLASFVDGAWFEACRSLCRSIRPALLIAHDLPLAMTALAVRDAEGIPVILDYRENWPAALTVWRRRQKKGIRDRLRTALVAVVHENGRRYRHIEIEAARRADAVLVVVEEYREQLARAGVPFAKLHVIENAYDPEDFEGEAAAFEPAAPERAASPPRASAPVFEPPTPEAPAPAFVPPSSPFLIVYAGGLDRFRGVQDVLRAMPAVLERLPQAFLLVLGDGEAKRSLIEEAKRLGVDRATRFTGWVPPQAVGAAFRAATVGVVPHRKNVHTDGTMPNKIYQLLQAGVPIVTGDAAPLARFVTNTGCGLVARSSVPESYARALLTLADPGERAERAGRARAACLYWTDEAPKLVAVCRRVAKACVEAESPS